MCIVLCMPLKIIIHFVLYLQLPTCTCRSVLNYKFSILIIFKVNDKLHEHQAKNVVRENSSTPVYVQPYNICRSIFAVDRFFLYLV